MPRELPARVLLLASLGLALAVHAAVVFTDEGISWPDEVYQSLEPAHWAVFGYGLKPWEFIDGARNWTLPGLVAVLLKLCALFGGDSPLVYVRVVKLAFGAASVAGAWGVYRLAVGQGASERLGAAAAAAWALCVPAVYFGARAMSENASAAVVVWGLALALEKDAPRRAVILGASLLGLGVLFRLQAGVFAAGVVATLAVRAVRATPRGPAAQRGLWALGTLTGWALAFGLVDALAWHDAPGALAGGWFHSAVVYVRFNLVENRGAQWGTAPWSYYLEVLWRSMPPLAVAVGAGAVLSARRAPAALAIAAVFFALHCAVPHKEYRFILPVLPVLFSLAAVGLFTATRWLNELWLVAGLVALAAHSAWSARALTFADLGAYPERGAQSAWDDFGGVNRLMLAASRRGDLCGLRIDLAHLAWTGGSTYLHRRAPLYMPGTPHQSGHFNYVITAPGSGAEVIATDHELELVRIPGMSNCVSDPDYTWRLP